MALDADGIIRGREDFPSDSLRRESISRKALKCKNTDFISNKIRIFTFQGLSTNTFQRLARQKGNPPAPL